MTMMEKTCIAAGNGDAQAVGAWLDAGGGVNWGNEERNGATLLMVAASGGQEAMVRMLLQRGASVNLQGSNGLTALSLAAGNGNTTIVQALLDAKAYASLQDDGGRTALMWAEQAKQAATAQLLRQYAERQAAEAEVQGGPAPGSCTQPFDQPIKIEKVPRHFIKLMDSGAIDDNVFDEKSLLASDAIDAPLSKHGDLTLFQFLDEHVPDPEEEDCTSSRVHMVQVLIARHMITI